MARRTTTSYALLGLLALRSWTTYELAKQAQRSLNWFWPRAERKLYEEPKHLVEAGLATARTESTGKRPRTVYSITRAGRRELARWLGDPPVPRAGEFEAMVKVFFADSGTRDQLLATLDRIESEALERIGALAGQTEEESAFPERLHVNALSIRLYFDQEQAVLAWTRWARQQVETWRSTTDPGDWDAPAMLRDMAAWARTMGPSPAQT
jgi:DNA-binding PadR family transcriptional regulator